jgi:hypothetical protein
MGEGWCSGNNFLKGLLNSQSNLFIYFISFNVRQP